jgi:poly(3-hydroxybutyrate) depolymerase
MFENAGLYQLYEWQQASVAPLRMFANASKQWHSNPLLPWAYTGIGRSMSAGFELLERLTKRYAKPEFGITSTQIDGKRVAVHDKIVLEKTFCNLRRFRRDTKRNDPKILVVAPMSGHYATLLRGTVAGLLPHADVYITDWMDAKEVPAFLGKFDLDDYIAYLMEFIRFIGKGTHTIAVCQPAVPLYAAVALMSEANDPFTPASMTLMGGPIDTRRAPTQVNRLATERPLDWFGQHVISRVPGNYPGFMRRVYPGFLQLTGFMTMNLDRHIGEHFKLYQHLVQGDGESADAHREFYDEYLSVADLPAEFYLQTIDKVFQRQLLPRGKFDFQDRIVRPESITKTGLLCVEGERDDISGIGQTRAAIRLSSGLPYEKKRYYLQRGVGHYGIFNGRKYREFIVPVIMEHIRKNS